VKPTSFDAYVRVPSRSDTLSRAATAKVINAAVQPDMTQTGGYAAEVPFVDLAPTNGAVADGALARIRRTIADGDFINGAAVDEFERAFAAWAGRRDAVGLSSGLDGLRLALLATGLEPGQGVIVPAATFAATFEAVLQAGGSPIVVDATETDYGLDVAAVEGAARDASHVIPVHLYGQLADMRSLARVAEANRLRIVEDACQAHGARRDGVVAGELSDVAAFSFYPAKNLGAMGDAGAVVTDDEDAAGRIRALRVHGETRKYHHEHVGYTARLDTIQACVLLEKLPLLDGWNRERVAAAAFYTEALAGIGELRLPPQPAGSEPVWHLFVVRVPDPDALGAFLRTHGIDTGRHYPEPVHLAPAYRNLGYAPGDFPVAEALAREGLSLPLFPGITERQLDRVCSAVREFFATA
jgi:dTDP-4-amino-4,6-dideoxygalactose transaminase